MQRHTKNYLKSTSKLPHEILCELCGSSNSINIHHIQHRQKNNPLLDEPSNLIALCQDGCHTWIHSNNTQENKEKLKQIASNRIKL